MRRRWLFCLVALAVLGGACSGNDGAASGTGRTTSIGSTGSAPGGGATATGSGRTADLYFVQEAGSTTLSAPTAPDGTATLTMTQANPRSVYFTGARDPRAGTLPNQDLVDMLNRGKGGHDAALEWSDPTGRGTRIVTILSGAYDDASGSLVYTVRPIEPSRSRSAVVAAKAAPAPPQRPAPTPPGSSPGSVVAPTSTAAPSVGSPIQATTSALFIDPIDEDPFFADCQITVTNNTSNVLQISDLFDQFNNVNEQLAWDGALSVGTALSPTLYANSGRTAFACAMTITFNVWFWAYDNSQQLNATATLTFEDSVFKQSTWSCSVPDEVSCSVSANEKGQPFKLTATFTGGIPNS
jgi:hypothetical protein